MRTVTTGRYQNYLKGAPRVKLVSMKLTFLLGALLLPAFSFGSTLSLVSTIAVHNTGVDSSDNLVSPAAQTSFWTLSSAPEGATETFGSNPFRYYNGAYFPDTSSAAWVAPTASGTAGVNGYYTYDLTIDLTGLDPSTASISGIFGTDNEGSIYVNNNAGVASADQFTTPTNFTLTTGFVDGLNTIHVNVNNGGDPTAFFVQFDSATATEISGTPEPGTILLSCGGLAAVLYSRRNRSAR